MDFYLLLPIYFISKDSTKKNDYYREGTADATRNKSKSFFNFLWISIKGALLKSMTGHNKGQLRHRCNPGNGLHSFFGRKRFYRCIHK